AAPPRIARCVRWDPRAARPNRSLYTRWGARCCRRSTRLPALDPVSGFQRAAARRSSLYAVARESAVRAVGAAELRGNAPRSLVRTLRREPRVRGDLPGPRAHVPTVSAGARFRRPAMAVAAELERPVAFLTTWRTAVRHHPGASQPLARPVHLCRNVMRPRVRS